MPKKKANAKKQPTRRKKKSVKQMKAKAQRRKVIEKLPKAAKPQEICAELVQKAITQNQKENDKKQEQWLKEHNEEYIHLRRKTVYKIAMAPVIATAWYTVLATAVGASTAPAWASLGATLGAGATLVGALYLTLMTYDRGGFWDD